MSHTSPGASLRTPTKASALVLYTGHAGLLTPLRPQRAHQAPQTCRQRWARALGLANITSPTTARHLLARTVHPETYFAPPGR